MFFKKFFTKDYRFYFERGEKYFAEEKFADARHEYQEALLRLNDEPEGISTAGSEIRNRLTETGNRLALLNLSEAEFAISRGDYAKAAEHLDLVAELAEDPSIEKTAEGLRGRIKTDAPAVESNTPGHGCAGCATGSVTASDNDLVPEFLSPQERFELLVQTLPGPLQKRYAGLGERFATGYLMVHGGDEEAGIQILQDLLHEDENDILLYEIALSRFRAGNLSDCETLLWRAFELNSENALCCLGLVQLLTEAGRLEESLPILDHMIDRHLLIEQSLLFLGDVRQGLGDAAGAIESYSKALTYSTASRAAAERLVPLFEKQGRKEDAEFVAKRYLKGCC